MDQPAPRSDTAPWTPRRLFASLRERLALGNTPLPKLIELVAGELATEVCSLYVMRTGEVLELIATCGLELEAVGRTRLRLGEGIVGLVAAMGSALNLADAREHPAFAQRPETGEAAFASLLAIPVRRSGHIIGVLTVQNRAPRRFSDIEQESLETVAMLLAEMLTAAGAVEVRDEGFGATLPRRFDGLALASGIVMGPIVRAEQRFAHRQVLAADPAVEQQRLVTASEQMRHGLEELIRGTSASMTDDASSDIIAAYRMIAADAGWLKRVSSMIEGGFSAEAAVIRVLGELREKMRRIPDPYLRERLVDIEDLGNRLVAQLHRLDPCGQPRPIVDVQEMAGAILVARRLGPAELLDWHARGIAGIVIEEGSAAGHAAILARSLGLPALSDARGVVDACQDGDEGILDTEDGIFILRPGDEVRQAYASAITLERAQAAQSLALRDQPAVTADGVSLSLMINLGLPLELPQLEATGAAGIGLYRTEIALLAQHRPESPLADHAAEEGFLASEKLMGRQIAEYTRVLDRAAGRPVLFRTLDLGGDKLLPTANLPESENPAMGWRSLRIGLDRPMILRRQLRAMLSAAQGRDLSIMFPMVATIGEFRAARGLLEAEVARLEHRPARLQVGTMLEVPALLWQLPQLMKEVDFVSVGSNDLMQFLFAADRGTPNLAGRYDLISPPVLDLLDSVVRHAEAEGVWLSFCGEAAGRPLEALILVALGFHSLSMSPASLLRVKTLLRKVDLAGFRKVLSAIRSHNPLAASLRDPLSSWAREHGLPV
ncbi:phosphoenolpyruvate--protein phosphotransferase [Acidisoma cellulosilyticum]|uniref:phosphoenolpyruvate--protein phosphotransferase n=1 Tax=Acidisoma cellulosilyticum TaxID=2802395 RepID=UPI001D0B7893|nr:phosphoenolpyruvate--protein phosphotransferase [Acidisoma cellulosilyticum]